MADRGRVAGVAGCTRGKPLDHRFERDANQLPAVHADGACPRPAAHPALPVRRRQPCVRRLRRQHDPAGIPAVQGHAPAAAAARHDNRRRAQRRRFQLGVVRGRLVECRRRRWCARLDERIRDGRVRGSGFSSESGMAVLPEQSVPVSPPAVQLLRELRARNAGADAPARRAGVHRPGQGLGLAVQAGLGQLRKADRPRERAPRLHERVSRQRPPRRPAAVDREQQVREGHDGHRHLRRVRWPVGSRFAAWTGWNRRPARRLGPR